MEKLVLEKLKLEEAKEVELREKEDKVIKIEKEKNGKAIEKIKKGGNK